jgi:hypothetical protein
MYPSLSAVRTCIFSRAHNRLVAVARMTPPDGQHLCSLSWPTRTERRWGFVFSGTGFECTVGVYQTPCLVTRPASWGRSELHQERGPSMRFCQPLATLL